MKDNSFRSSFPNDKADLEFGAIMVGIFLVCLLGFASNFIPELNTVMVLLFSAAGLAGIICLVRYVRKQRKLDYDAFYGPLDEKENT